ncbi:hypothetical protein H5410_037062 [Solanum commersonii]|uniref:Uncharacterized protein n=1 Tax=Solanum commersonii TaxID=4109 RepID=A0A9J5YA32_SOLCO|nr:hypothetical protein H5410_037062 [Solanum commersonii]
MLRVLMALKALLDGSALPKFITHTNLVILERDEDGWNANLLQEYFNEEMNGQILQALGKGQK